MVVSLERLGGALGGPHYFITVYGNGTVIYYGGSYVAVNGTHKTQISSDKVQELKKAFYDVNYFDMEDVYDCDYQHTNCFTDGQHSRTSITVNGETKAIYLYHGYLGAPEEIFQLEEEIENIASTRIWTDCPEAQWPLYHGGCTST